MNSLPSISLIVSNHPDRKNFSISFSLFEKSATL
nr:MAG TPA: hypothetical protein [Caudoviricetes sp.]